MWHNNVCRPFTPAWFPSIRNWHFGYQLSDQYTPKNAAADLKYPPKTCRLRAIICRYRGVGYFPLGGAADAVPLVLPLRSLIMAFAWQFAGTLLEFSRPLHVGDCEGNVVKGGDFHTSYFGSARVRSPSGSRRRDRPAA
jgi:hypothetical protein